MRARRSRAAANCRSAPATASPSSPATDDDGKTLDGRCDVRISGTTPQARFWTLTLYDPQGKLVGNSLERHGFTSQEIVRNADGSFDIAVAPRARAGNWLPTGGIDSYHAGAAALRLAGRRRHARGARSADAGGRAVMLLRARMKSAMIRWLLWLLGGALLGGIVHLVAVLMLPRTATQDAYSRLAPIRAGQCGRARCRSPRRRTSVMPFMDPAFAVGGLPLRPLDRPAQAHRAGQPRLYLGLILYPPRRRLLRDQRPRRRPPQIELDLMTAAQRAELPEDEEVTAADRLIVESPSPTGLIVMRALAPEPGTDAGRPRCPWRRD